MRVLPSVLPARPQEARIEENRFFRRYLVKIGCNSFCNRSGKYDILSCHFRKGSQNFSTRCLIDMKGKRLFRGCRLIHPAVST